MSAPTRATIAAQTARLERVLGLTPRPSATLEQRIAAVAAKQESKPKPKRTRAGNSDLSGDGERMDRLMGVVDRRTPLVEQRGNTVVMRTMKRDDARKHLESFAARYGYTS